MVSQYFGFLLVHKQWGYFTSATTVTLPIAFTSKHIQTMKSFTNNSYGKQFGASYLSVTSFTLTSFTNNYGDAMDGGYNYISIGI